MRRRDAVDDRRRVGGGKRRLQEVRIGDQVGELHAGEGDLHVGAAVAVDVDLKHLGGVVKARRGVAAAGEGIDAVADEAKGARKHPVQQDVLVDVRFLEVGDRLAAFALGLRGRGVAERVATRAAGERVIAGAANQGVVAGVAVKRIVTALADDVIVGGAAVENVGGSRAVNAGGGAAAEDQVVVAAIGELDVQQPRPGHRLHVGPRTGDAVGRGGVVVGDRVIRLGAGHDQVGLGGRAQGDGVGAAAGQDQVAVARHVQGIVAAGAGDQVVNGRDRVQPNELHLVQGVDAATGGAAIDPDRAAVVQQAKRIAGKRAVGVIRHVGVGAAPQDVVSAAAGDGVVAAETKNGVVAAEGVDIVGGRGSGDDIVRARCRCAVGNIDELGPREGKGAVIHQGVDGEGSDITGVRREGNRGEGPVEVRDRARRRPQARDEGGRHRSEARCRQVARRQIREGKGDRQWTAIGVADHDIREIDGHIHGGGFRGAQVGGRRRRRVGFGNVGDVDLDIGGGAVGAGVVGGGEADGARRLAWRVAGVLIGHRPERRLVGGDGVGAGQGQGAGGGVPGACYVDGVGEGQHVLALDVAGADLDRRALHVGAVGVDEGQPNIDGNRPAALGEFRMAGVQAAVGVVADEGEVIVGSIIAPPDHHDLAVGLQVNAIPEFGARSDRRRHLAAAAEGSVEAAVRIVTDQGKIIVGSIMAVPGN